MVQIQLKPVPNYCPLCGMKLVGWVRFGDEPYNEGDEYLRVGCWECEHDLGGYDEYFKWVMDAKRSHHYPNQWACCGGASERHEVHCHWRKTDEAFAVEYLERVRSGGIN